MLVTKECIICLKRFKAHQTRLYCDYHADSGNKCQAHHKYAIRGMLPTLTHEQYIKACKRTEDIHGIQE